jgi:hypothetical protein
MSSPFGTPARGPPNSSTYVGSLEWAHSARNDRGVVGEAVAFKCRDDMACTIQVLISRVNERSAHQWQLSHMACDVRSWKSEMPMIQKIISGGQTGADRAALDWAITNAIPHGGWCPKGRRAEDGIIPKRYQLEETPSRDHEQRTMWNVCDADATLIVTLNEDVIGGSLLTREYAKQIGKPYLHLSPTNDWRERIKAFLGKYSIQILNVAGPRRSEAPGIEPFVYEVLDEIKAIGLFRKPVPGIRPK